VLTSYDRAGVKLNDDQVKMLKKARRGNINPSQQEIVCIIADTATEGRFHEALLDVRVKFGKHDKFSY